MNARQNSNAMRKFTISTLTALTIMLMSGCGNNQNSQTENKTAPIQKYSERHNMIAQKITPCLWVDKDAKAVADYYLSIFKNGKLKEYHKYENPPEAKEIGGQDFFETAVIEIAGVELDILAAGP